MVTPTPWPRTEVSWLVKTRGASHESSRLVRGGGAEGPPLSPRLACAECLLASRARRCCMPAAGPASWACAAAGAWGGKADGGNGCEVQTVVAGPGTEEARVSRAAAV